MIDIVLLAAGLSRRMGKVNKLLLPVEGVPMCTHCALRALEYLDGRADGGRLIVVTGYRYRETEKALRPCVDYTAKSAAPIEMIVVRNPDYRAGQFSSTKTGVENVRDGAWFFISLADMPSVGPQNYNRLEVSRPENLHGSCQAVRPFSNSLPGHPVLHSPELKQRLLAMDDSRSVHELLQSCSTLNVPVDGKSWITDIDTPEDTARTGLTPFL